MAETDYLFIDGACLQSHLRQLSNDYFGGDTIDLRYIDLSIGEGFSKTFYYDALPPRKQNELDEDHKTRQDVQLAFFDKLQSIPGWHVYQGDARLRERGRAVEQKMVDIMIAVDMLMHSFRRNMTRATLLTGDLDFKPLVDALVQAGMYVTLWYPPRHTNRLLIHAADAAKPLDIERVYGWTSNEFRQSHGIPQARHQVGKPTDMGGYSCVESWNDQQGREVQLFQGTYGYSLVGLEEHNPRHAVIISHNTLEPLKVYVAEKYRYIDWPKAVP